MPCVKCNGVWQCSVGDDPCEMGQAFEPIASETHCIAVMTKSESDGCKMKIKMDGKSEGDWDDAGSLCFQFDLYKDADTGQCYVRISSV